MKIFLLLMVLFTGNAANAADQTYNQCAQDQRCSSTQECGGECQGTCSYDSSCGGGGIEVCTLQCQNGGILNESDCSCMCMNFCGIGVTINEDCSCGDEEPGGGHVTTCQEHQYLEPIAFTSLGTCHDCPMPDGAVGCIVRGTTGISSCVLSSDPSFDGECNMSDVSGRFEIIAPCPYES